MKKKNVLIFFVACVLVASQAILPGAALSEFYVIPVGSSSLAPSNLIELGAPLVIPGTAEGLRTILKDASNGPLFTVPAGKVLVINAVHIFPQSTSVKNLVVGLIQNGRGRQSWTLPSDVPTQLFFPAGMIIGAGYGLQISNFANSGSDIKVSIYGYLTSDK